MEDHILHLQTNQAGVYLKTWDDSIWKPNYAKPC